MSNTIGFNNMTNVSDSINMSNGTTNVFINVLALSGSYLAKTDTEKRMIVWLSEKDQTMGLGNVGFDVVEMPWSRQSFESDKKFMLEVIKQAKSRLSWEVLDYTPNEAIIFPLLDKFNEYIKQMSESDIDETETMEWIKAAQNDDPIKCNFPKCTKHETLLTFLGCQICNS